MKNNGTTCYDEKELEAMNKLIDKIIKLGCVEDESAEWDEPEGSHLIFRLVRDRLPELIDLVLKDKRIADKNEVILPKWLYDQIIDKCRAYDLEHPPIYSKNETHG